MGFVDGDAEFGESVEAEVAHLVGDVGVESGYGDADFYVGAVEEFWG